MWTKIRKNGLADRIFNSNAFFLCNVTQVIILVRVKLQFTSESGSFESEVLATC